MDAVGLRDEFSDGNQLRKAGRIAKVSCTVMVIGRKRSPFISFSNCNDYGKSFCWETFPPTSLFPLVHVEFVFLWRKNLEGLCFIVFTLTSLLIEHKLMHTAMGCCGDSLGLLHIIWQIMEK